MTSDASGQLRVAFPSASDLRLRVALGACRLDVRRGAGDAWVRGGFVEAPPELRLAASQDGGKVRISHGQDFTDLLGALGRGLPACQLLLGDTKPYSLGLEIGAGEYRLDLGGLPITRLDLKHGLGRVRVDFSLPNPVEMARLNMGGGAGELDLRNLGNANSAQIKIEGGMASSKIDFGGQMRRDTEVQVSAAFSTVEISVPHGTACRVRPDGALVRTDADAGFRKVDEGYWTEAAVAGHHPLLLIRTSAVAGGLTLRST